MQWVDFIRKRPGETVDARRPPRGDAIERCPSRSARVDGRRQDDRPHRRFAASSCRRALFEVMRAEQRYGVLESLPRGVAEDLGDDVRSRVRMIAHMVVGDVSLKNMSGRSTIADVAGEQRQAGLAPFLSFLAVVSISLGISICCRCRCSTAGRSSISSPSGSRARRCPSVRSALGQQIGMFFLIVLMSFAFYNDLTQNLRFMNVFVASVVQLGGAARRLSAASLSAHAAFEPFVVRNFRVEGAQRIAEGTIYNYLPINIGDTVDEQRLREASRAMFQTGFFQDFEFRTDGDTLVIVVLERPSIREFTFTGNKDIKDDDLKKSLTSIGLAQGKIFDRSVLDEVTQSLTEEYYGRGKYAREDHADGRAARGQQGARLDHDRGRRPRQDSPGQHRRQHVVRRTRTSSPASSSRPATGCRSSARTIATRRRRSRATSRSCGRSTWTVASRTSVGDDVQVAISPDKRDIFVTISVTEGDRYTISDVKLAGEMVVPEDDLKSLIVAQPGETFSQGLLTQTEKSSWACGSARTATRSRRFARVPELNKETKQASRSRSSSIRRTASTCGASTSTAPTASTTRCSAARCARSKAATCRTRSSIARRSCCSACRTSRRSSTRRRPVPGSPDLVDVDFKIEEGLPGQFGGSLGFSETYGVTLGGNFVHSNFMGTGNRVALDLQRRQVPEGLRRELHGPVSHHRRPVARSCRYLSGHHAVHVGDFGLLDDDAVGRHQLGLPDHGVPERCASASRIRTPSSLTSTLQLAAGARVGARRTASHIDRSARRP